MNPRAGSNRWSELAAAGDGPAYARRFADLAAAGSDVHGEATFCASLLPAGGSVLDAGCGTGRVALRLAAQGYACVGVDADASMLGVATAADAAGVAVQWVLADLADLPGRDVAAAALDGPFDLVVAAGNVLPLLAAGTEQVVVANLARRLAPGGFLVAGFGLDAAHLPLAFPPFGLAEYDVWCAHNGLELAARYATWDRKPYTGQGYAVSVHRSARSADEAAEHLGR